MSNRNLIAVSLFWALTALGAYAQTPTIQDCLGAIPVCQEMYSESSSPSGTGAINEIQSGETCTDGEINSIWYLFTTNEAGNLGFLITPNNPNDDYDWALFDLTDATCEQLTANPLALVVSCNAAGGGGCHGPTGATGATNLTNAPGGCGFGNSPQNALVPMQAGQTYALMVSNWTGSTNGYTIDFGLSSGVDFVDDVPPFIKEAVTPTMCGDDEIVLTFSEFMSCASMANSAFTLTGPGGTYTIVDVDGVSCGQGGAQSTEFILTISPPLQARGDFELLIEPQGGNDVLDLCGNQAEDFTYAFTADTPVPISPSIGADTSLVCAGDTLILDASSLGTSFLWSDGSTAPTLAVTDAGMYAVTIEDACGTGSDELEVFVQQMPPTVDLGADQLLCAGETVFLNVTNDLSTYQWSDGSTQPMRAISTDGLFAVSVTNACGTTTDEIDLAFVPDLNPDFGQRVLCFGETAELDFTHPYATYSWSDGSTAALRQITDDFVADLTITTPCETMTGTVEVLFLRDPTLELGADTTLCPGDSLWLVPGIPGGDYQWQDGTTADQFLVTTGGTYALTLTTACNELVDQRRIEYIPPIQTDLGPDTFLCAGASLLLDATAQAPVIYTWDDGSMDARRRIEEPGTYLVSVVSDCESIMDTLTVTLCEVCDVYMPNAFSPNGDGRNDRLRPFSDCEMLDVDFRIFDRWGQAVFATDDPARGWEGTSKGQPAALGV